MKFQDLTTLLEQDSMFIARDNNRHKRYEQIIQQRIQEYIKNGSKGNLILNDTPIKSLPDNLVKVGGDLDIDNTNITKLPPTLKLIEGSFASSSKFTQYPAHVKINGSVNISRTNITEIPPNIKFHGDLNINSSKVSKLPDNLYLPGTLLASFCDNLTELPNRLNVMSLWLTKNPNITHVPKDITVRGTAYIDKNAPAFKSRGFRQQFLSGGPRIYPGILRVYFV